MGADEKKRPNALATWVASGLVIAISYAVVIVAAGRGRLTHALDLLVLGMDVVVVAWVVRAAVSSRRRWLMLAALVYVVASVNLGLLVWLTQTGW